MAFINGQWVPDTQSNYSLLGSKPSLGLNPNNFMSQYNDMAAWGNNSPSVEGLTAPQGALYGSNLGSSFYDSRSLQPMPSTNSPTGSMFDNMLGPNGWGNLAMGGAGFLGNVYMGMKQYGLAKNQLNEERGHHQGCGHSAVLP